MSEAFEEIAHLASSENRIRVLQRLAEAPAARRELQDDLAVSQSTASRTLADFEARGWVVRFGRTYEITPLGRIVARAFARVVETMEAAADLRDLLGGLPIDGEGLDLTDFADATVTIPTPANPFGVARPVVERFAEGEHVRGLTRVVAPEALEAGRRSVVDRGQRLEIVLDRDLVDTIRSDPSMRSALRDIVAADRASAYVHDDVPVAIGIVDGYGQIAISDENGTPLALVESENDRVREWIASTFESYRRDARRLAPEDFEGDG